MNVIELYEELDALLHAKNTNIEWLKKLPVTYGAHCDIRMVKVLPNKLLLTDGTER